MPKKAEAVSTRSMLLLAVGAGLLLAGITTSREIVVDASHSKHDLARLRVKVIAYELFPQWARSNPERACPKSVSELVTYGENKSIKDPWGHPYLFTCGEHRIYVVSLGPDGKANTTDDIWSHQ